jgi:four helix bundle protein
VPGSYKQLNVWKKSIDLTDAFYTATDKFPRHELFGIVSQMRRAAVSIPSNIAEGQAHHSHRDFIRFLRQSRGSLAELQTQLIISVRCHYLNRELGRQLFREADEIDKMLSGLISSLQKQLETDAD